MTHQTKACKPQKTKMAVNSSSVVPRLLSWTLFYPFERRSRRYGAPHEGAKCRHIVLKIHEKNDRARGGSGPSVHAGANLQGGKTFCASFCASLIAGSRRAFLCVVCLFVTERVLNEMHKVWTFASRKASLLLCGFCFSTLENYFGLGTTNVKGKTDHPISLRWNKEFCTFPKRRVFFWLFIRLICELISPSFAGLN